MIRISEDLLRYMSFILGEVLYNKLQKKTIVISTTKTKYIVVLRVV